MKLKRIILSDFMFVVIMLLLILLSVFSYQRINDLTTKSDLVNHTNTVKLTLEQTLSHIRDAETRQRFFLLTGDSTYLDPHLEGVEKNGKNLALLAFLTNDNDSQQVNLQTLKVLTNSRFRQLDEVASSSGSRPDNMTGLLAEGRNTMDKITALISKMTEVEDRLLEIRTSKKNYAASITPFYLLLLSVFAISIVGFAYYILRSETRLRFDAQDNIKKLNDYFKDLPAIFAIVKGPGHVHELANDLYRKLSGNRDLSGKSYREAFPELSGQGFYELLDEVYQSGKLFIGREMPVSVDKGNGVFKKSYFNFIYQPIVNKQNKTDGILIFGYDITEMIEARNKVQETEQRSRLAIEAASIGTFDWDLENNRFVSSERLIEIFGFRRIENVTHQDLLAIFHPEDKPNRDKAVRDSLVTGALNYEARIIWPDKSVHWINIYGKVVYDDLKKALRMFGTAIDITTQKHSLEELKISEARFRLLADSMPQFIWTGDAAGNLDYFNQAVFDYSGLTPDDIYKEGWIDIVHPEDREENIKKWGAAITTGEVFIFEHRFRNKDGLYRWQLSRALPQRDAQNRIQRWVGTSTDIDDQKNLSEKLEHQVSERTEELRELNKDLVIRNNIFVQAEENALIGSYSWNLQTGKLEYSDNLFRLFGYEPNEFVPSFEKYHSLIHPEDQEQVMKDGLETINTKKLVGHNYRIITKKGKIKHFRSTGKIFDEGENLMLIGTVQDITQDTLLNEDLRLKNLQLERSNTELESFNYIASHDLQEPLRKIQAFSERIVQKEGAKFTQFGKDYFARIISAASRMQHLINALLSYSRATGNQQKAVSVSLDIVIENAIAELQEIITEKNAVIEYNRLPVIQAVNLQIHQLFINLISNAIKYSRTGIAPLIIITAGNVKGKEINDAAADKKLNYWKISIADNGIGFEQQYEEKIFELFQRLHTNDHYTGTGIGLAICKKIVRNHQGFISATGKPGIGSIFNVYFPVL